MKDYDVVEKKINPEIFVSKNIVFHKLISLFFNNALYKQPLI